MIGWIGGWFDRRLRLAKVGRNLLNHVFPDHWSFMLGEAALYSFAVLVITGVFMAVFFNASANHVIYHGDYRPLDGVPMSTAYQSVIHLSFDVPAGLLIRQMHHWAALIFVGAIVAHLARIFFTAAYRRPREINWMIGLTLLILALVNGYLGYSLGDDLLSGTGLRIAYAVLLSIPVIGPWLTFICLGGVVPAPATIPRMYGLHILVVPVLICLLLALHLTIIWRQMHTNFPGPGRTDRTIVGSRLWPSYAAKSLGLFCLVFGAAAALGGLVQINPVWIYGPYDPSATLPGAQPDWYLGWVEGAMRLFPGVNLHLNGKLIPEVFFPAVLFPTLLFAMLYAYPFLHELFTFDRGNHNVLLLPYQQPFSTALGCAVFSFLLVLFFAGSDDVIAVAMGGSVVAIRATLRTLALVLPPAIFLLVYFQCLRSLRRQ